MNLRRGLPALLTAAGLTTLAMSGSAFAVGNLPGRFTGGGQFPSDTGVMISHGFELYCDTATAPNNLEINWAGGNHWHLENLTHAACSLRQDPAPPVAGLSVYNGNGLGSLNGVPGFSADWRIIDNGEPGTKDRMALVIKDPSGNVVIQTDNTDPGNGALLVRGNHQAHDLTGRAAR
jgi:hypothetical protein